MRLGEADVRPRLTDLLQRAGCGADIYADAMECVRDHARVVVHFHPDRFGSKPVTVAEALLGEGAYRNQFETGLSTGSLTAFRGGARDSWESKLFGGAYHSADVTNADRPKIWSLGVGSLP